MGDDATLLLGSVPSSGEEVCKGHLKERGGPWEFPHAHNLFGRECGSTILCNIFLLSWWWNITQSGDPYTWMWRWKVLRSGMTNWANFFARQTFSTHLSIHKIVSAFLYLYLVDWLKAHNKVWILNALGPWLPLPMFCSLVVGHLPANDSGHGKKRKCCIRIWCLSQNVAWQISMSAISPII